MRGGRSWGPTQHPSLVSPDMNAICVKNVYLKSHETKLQTDILNIVKMLKKMIPAKALMKMFAIQAKLH